MMGTVIQQAQISVPAGQTVPFAGFGDFLYCKAANVAFTVTGRDEQNRFPMQQGVKVKLTTADKSYYIENNTASDLVAVLIFGFGDYEDDQFTGTVAVTPGTNRVGLPKVTLTGGLDVLAPAGATRKELHLKAPVTNAGDVWIDGAVDVGIPLSPGDTYILDAKYGLSAVGSAGDVVYVAEVLE